MGIRLGIGGSSGIVVAPPPSPFVNDRSLLLDGVDEYASRAGAAVTGCEFDTFDPFTVNVWVRTSTTGVGIAASKIDPGGSQRGWTFGILNSRPFLGLNSNIGLGLYMQAYVDQVVATGAWKMITAVYDGSGVVSGVSFFVNGTDAYPGGQTTQAYVDLLGGGTTLGGAAAPLAIGSQSGTAFFLDGDLDEVSVWSAALTPAEVAALIAPDGSPANLVGLANLDSWYRCGEAAGDSATGDIHDISGNGNDVACANMEVADITTDTAAYWWQNLSVGFDGIDERLYSSPAGNAPTYDTFDPFSASVWFKTTTATYGALVAKELTHPSYIGWCLFIHTNNALRVEISGGGAAYIDVITNTTGWNDGAWHHVLFCWDGSGGAAGVSLYIDGALQATTIQSDTLGGGSILTSDPFTIGCRGGPLGAWLPYDGRIDEVSIYSATLSLANAVELYNSGTPRDAMALTTAADIDAYYRCGDATFDAISLVQPSVYDVSGNNYDLSQANMEQADFNPDTP